MLERVLKLYKAKGMYAIALKICTISLLIAFALILVNDAYALNQNINPENRTEIVNANSEENSAVLNQIDDYQEKYFDIAKRNNVLLRYDDDKELVQDKKDMKKLYQEVLSQITNKKYLKKYKIIEKRYSKCTEITTVGMNEFMNNYYNDIDALLNEVYNEVKQQLPNNDFKKLSQSERNWLKEVEEYKKVYNSMDFGMIGVVLYYDYQIDMRKFRTLLLMTYL